ncbi:hypothetical protein C0J52_02471 [Blattella germanica]|nr:hypothetical protein C0J52_02471 [Blattella germanica]
MLRGQLAAAGVSERKLYSTVTANEIKEKRFKLMVKSKTNQTGEEIKQTLKSSINPTSIRVGVNAMKSMRDGRIMIETGSKEEVEKLNTAIREKCCQQLETTIPKLWNPNLIIYNIPEELTIEGAEDTIISQDPELGLKNGDLKPKFIFTTRRKSRNLVVEWRAVEMDPAGVSGTVTVEDQRSYIKIETLRGKNPREIHRALSEVCGELTVDRSTVSRWVHRFRVGRMNIDDDPRTGRPRTSTDERSVKLAKLLLATYLDETVYVDLETSISNYKEAVDACLSMEKSYVCLAQFYERIISTFGTDEDTTKYSGAGGMVVNASGKDAPRHSKFTREFILLADKLTELTEKTVDQESKKRGTVTVSKLCQSLPRFLGSMSSDIMVPLQQSFNTYLPRDQKDYEGHNPYKGLMVNFVGIRESVMILNSLQLPKCITILASNGKEYSLMCKSRDDLRRDFRYMEFSNVVNQYLRNEPASKQRNLHIRTYESIDHSPKSVRCLTCQLPIPKSTGFKVLKCTLKKHAYHLEVLH